MLNLEATQDKFKPYNLLTDPLNKHQLNIRTYDLWQNQTKNNLIYTKSINNKKYYMMSIRDQIYRMFLFTLLIILAVGLGIIIIFQYQDRSLEHQYLRYDL